METITRQESQICQKPDRSKSDPLFTISPEGKITDINNASINITEVTREKFDRHRFF